MKNIAIRSAVIYTGLSLLLAGLFLLGTLSGEYRPVERIGGAAWVFLLAMIILMPLVMPIVRKRAGRP